MTEQKPRILMIGPGRNVRGGISTVVNHYYAAGLDNRVNLRYIPTMLDGPRIQNLAVAAAAFLRFLLCFRRYDVLHVHMAAQASFWRKRIFVKAAKKRGMTVVIHQHSADFDHFFQQEVDGRQRKEIKYIFEIADAVLALSDTWADLFRTLVSAPEKVLVLPNAVACPVENKSDYSDHWILFLGRLGERKGTFDLLQAVPAILKAVPDVKLILCGDGEIAACRREAQRLGVANCVEFPGWVDAEQREALFSACSLFVLPSHHEGMPMALLEAMAHGLAAVSTDVGGIPQVIESHVNGVCIPAGDTRQLAETVTSLLLCPKKKERIGQAGKKTIQSRFGIEANLLQLTDFYDKLCKKPKECTK
ncbi:glycosyltransferase family 4 protein [Anaeromassilibacillus senegalensis]|uniref:Glycosyltransferase family 4 protein n=1 Tax=Anaeromassilibacillus senegalensis TaxID=1673717 RepID=A0ABS9CLE3_9FIRM|nr:glycosyltransferase family 4 protein [Anaeromassilibacillus senegalensis]MCF2651180.1 glycosyltransferase family 4 protein [Anaeromassilibacillus senegalensis]